MALQVQVGREPLRGFNLAAALAALGTLIALVAPGYSTVSADAASRRSQSRRRFIADGDPDQDADTHCDSNGNAHRNQDTDAHRDQDQDSHSHAHPYAHSEPDARGRADLSQR